ncbi:hypothetical protein ACTXJX_14870 [Glutamicibacter ardleyensis]|uniref:hypothetical protein n=1 Tax=Glutamicibacter ardleyensis TaxID=225894 RepID=UPI003FD169E4
MSNMSDRASRNMLVGTMMSWGNTMFKSATEFVTFSTNFCFLDKAGGAIDNIAGTIGKKIFSSEVMAFLIVALIVYLGWTARRSGALDVKALFTKIAVIALVLFMSFQATQSTGGGAGKGGDLADTSTYVPATGSFGWAMVTANNTLSAIISAPAGLFENGINGDGNIYDNDSVGATNKWPLSCSMYVKGMRDEYVSTYPQDVYGLNSGMPLMLDSMWQEMGLRAYRTASFGYNLPNPQEATKAYDDQAWCRLLEWNAGIPGTKGYDKAEDVNSNQEGRVPSKSGDLESGTSQRHALSKAGLGDNLPTAPGIGTGSDGGVVGKSPGDELWPYTWQGNAFNPGKDVEKQRSLLAWSACNLLDGQRAGESSSWEIRGDFKQIFPDSANYPEECAKWFRGYDDPGNTPWAGDGRQDAKKFEFPTTKGEVDEKVAKSGGNPALAKYIKTINGNDNQQSMASASVYIVAAFVLSAVFFIFGALTLVAKIFLALLIFGFLVGLLLMCMPKGVPTTLLKTGKMTVSIILLTSVIGFLFSLITMLSRMFQTVGNLFLMQGSIMHLLWMGLTPVVAIFGLHFLFKLTNVPSPFTKKGISQWAKAGGAGAIGGAVGSGITQMRQGGRNMLSRADRRRLGMKGRGSRGLSKLKRSASNFNSQGENAGEDTGRNKFSKKIGEPESTGGANEPTEADGSSGGEQQPFRKPGRTGAPSSERDGAGEDGKPKAKRFSAQAKLERLQESRQRSQDKKDEGSAIEHALNDPNTSRADRRLLEEQQSANRNTGDKFRDASVRAYSGANQAFGAVRSKESWKNGAKNTGRGLLKGAQGAGRGVKRGVTSEKFKRALNDPGGALASGTVALGKVAKTTAKYGAIGVGLTMASALTGGVAAPILIGGAVAGMNAGRIARGGTKAYRAGANAVKSRKQRLERRQGAVNRSMANYRSPEAVKARGASPITSSRHAKTTRVLSPKAKQAQVNRTQKLEVRNAKQTREREARKRDLSLKQAEKRKAQWNQTSQPRPNQIGSVRGANWKPRQRL